MALGDITIYSKDNNTGYPGDINYPVATAATVPTILSGEPVARPLGANQVPVSLASGKPIVGTDYLLGIAATTSTETTSGSVNGSVSVTPIDESVTYLVSTLATATYFGSNATGLVFPNQATYDALVGARVTLARTGGVGAGQLGGVYTINATDSSANGLVVEELDVNKFPGKVRFSIRNGVSYMS